MKPAGNSYHSKMPYIRGDEGDIFRKEKKKKTLWKSNKTQAIQIRGKIQSLNAFVKISGPTYPRSTKIWTFLFFENWQFNHKLSLCKLTVSERLSSQSKEVWYEGDFANPKFPTL